MFKIRSLLFLILTIAAPFSLNAGKHPEQIFENELNATPPAPLIPAALPALLAPEPLFKRIALWVDTQTLKHGRNISLAAGALAMASQAASYMMTKNNQPLLKAVTQIVGTGLCMSIATGAGLFFIGLQADILAD